MYIAINIIICLAIFGYTIMSLYKFFKRSKSGNVAVVRQVASVTIPPQTK